MPTDPLNPILGNAYRHLWQNTEVTKVTTRLRELAINEPVYSCRGPMYGCIMSVREKRQRDGPHLAGNNNLFPSAWRRGGRLPPPRCQDRRWNFRLANRETGAPLVLLITLCAARSTFMCGMDIVGPSGCPSRGALPWQFVDPVGAQAGNKYWYPAGTGF